MEKRRYLAKKPKRGSFILDHNNDCTLIKNQYLKCLKANNNDHIFCRNYSKEYFLCRMENNLLERQSLENLGFFENEMKDVHGNRMDGFKDVYSYNMYNEKMELLSKAKQVPNTHSEVNINMNDIKEDDRKEKEKGKDKNRKEDYIFADNHSFKKSKETEEKNVSKEQTGDTFLLLNIHKKKQTPLLFTNSGIENLKKNEDQKKNGKQKRIEIRRKEVDGYLAGKEYIKALASRRKKNKIGTFINSFFFKVDQGGNDVR